MRATQSCEEFERTHPEFKSYFNDCKPNSTADAAIDCSVKIGGSAFVGFIVGTLGPEVVITALGAYAIYKSIQNPIGTDRECFYDLETKRARIEKFNSISDEPRFHLSVEQNFIENVTCKDLQKMLEAKWRMYLIENKNSPDVYLSKKIDNGVLTTGLAQTLQNLYTHRACLRPDIVAGLVCGGLSLASGYGAGLAASGPNAILNRSLRAQVEKIWPKSVTTTTSVPSMTGAVATSPSGPAIATTSEVAPASQGMNFAQQRRAAAKAKGEKKTVQTEINGLPKFERKLDIPKPKAVSLDFELSSKFPQLENRLRQIDVRFTELSEAEAAKAEKLVRTGYKNIFTSNEFSKNPQIFSMQDREAYAKVARHLSDTGSWQTYSKNLFIEAAEWISKKGNTNELTQLTQVGEISERSLIAVLFRRAEERGDKFAKASSREIEDFAKMRTAGVWVDRVIPTQNGHGQFSHLLQMDYVAPVLRSHYDGNHSAFYQFLEKQCERCWTQLFDNSKVQSFQNSNKVHQFFKDLLPIKGKDSAH